MKSIPSLAAVVATFSLAAITAALAQNAPAGHSMAGHSMAGHSMAVDKTMPGHASAPRHVFMQPVQSVFDNYIRIEGALAQDSIQGVSGAAAAIVQAVRGDSMKMLPPKVADQAQVLAQAKDLDSARKAFKPLSDSLVQHLKEHKTPPGAYYEAYCPMAKASWLQTSKTIMNPYMGKQMLHCGQIKG